MDIHSIPANDELAKKAMACACAAALVGSVTVPAAAAFADEPVTKSESPDETLAEESATDLSTASYVKNENVYGILDARGDAQDLYVVNQFDVQTAGVVVDFGAYDQVENLTDTSSIAITGNQQFFDAPQGLFYYQGCIEGGELPWNVSINYTLDGKSIAPEDLAGANGRVGVRIDTTKSAAVDNTFYDNYMLQVSFSVPADRCRNIDTQEAGIVSDAGENRQVTYTVMPGKDGDLIFEADAQDFEMSAIQIAGAPFSMAMDDFDTDALVDGIQELADGAASLNSGTSELASGTEDLASGTSQLSQGAWQLSDGTNQLAGGAADLSLGLAQLADGASQTATASSQMADGLTSLSESSGKVSGAAAQSASEAQALAEALKELDTDKMDPEQAEVVNNLKDQAATAAELAAGTSAAAAGYTAAVDDLALGFSKLDSGIQSLSDGIGQTASGAEGLAAGASKLASGASDLASGTSELASGTEELANGTSQLASGVSEFAEGTAELPTKMKEEMDEAMASYSGDFEPVSFASPENDTIQVVQFVLTTKAIEVPDEDIPVEEEPELDFFQRLTKLFTGSVE